MCFCDLWLVSAPKEHWCVELALGSSLEPGDWLQPHRRGQPRPAAPGAERRACLFKRRMYYLASGLSCTTSFLWEEAGVLEWCGMERASCFHLKGVLGAAAQWNSDGHE